MIIRLLLLFSLGFGANYYQSNSPSSYVGVNIPETLRLVGIMAQFPIENPDNPKTSGDGNFLKLDSEEYNHFYDSTTPRCEGFIVDKPPHNSAYFQKQLEAVKNYYLNISGENLTFTTNIISNSNSPDGYYTVSDSMEYYAKGDALLAEFFSEALNLAKSDIESLLTQQNVASDEVVFIVFHAGLGQDISLPGLDPTIYDLKSAYIDEEMMVGVTPTEIHGYTPSAIDDSIKTGILLPETQNMIYYDIVEDIFGNPDYGTDDLCDIQLGLTGIFAFLLGYELGLPPLFNPETGDPGVGFFGLMDHGSNNGRGVIPASPSPWTRSLPDSPWSTIETISPIQSLDTTITVYALDSLNILYRFDISENEYFLIENRNNWVSYQTDIDSLRRKHKIDENQAGHWFDTVIEEFPEDQIQIDEDTHVITGFDHYDYGLPGSGILIWHIKEPDPSIYNNDLYNRHIQIEEADGSVDIGSECYHWNANVCDMVTKGWQNDFWFNNNYDYFEYGNPYAEEVIFDDMSSPNTRTTDGSKSFLSIKILSEISESMDIRITFSDGIEIVHLTDGTVQYLGNAVQNDIGFVYYAKDDSIYSHSHLVGPITIDEYIPMEDSIILTCCNNNELDTIIISDKHYAWIDTLSGELYEDIENYKSPMAYIEKYNEPKNAESSLAPSDSSLSFGDLDLDGLDEIITIEYGNIIAKNSNGTLVNGFPASGGFSGVPLISNILPPQYGSDMGKPEIVCREGDDIVILSNRGERLRQLSSYDINQPLAMVPFWRGDTTMALIDGSRLFLFDLDLDHSYWLNPRSRPSGFPLSTGDHFEPNNSSKMRTNAYNYPNPITDGSTTFRFFVRSPEVSEVKINIYNAAGYLVEDNLIKNVLTHYEFNEIIWDASQFDAGLYLAEIKPNLGNSELVRLVVIK